MMRARAQKALDARHRGALRRHDALTLELAQAARAHGRRRRGWQHRIESAVAAAHPDDRRVQRLSPGGNALPITSQKRRLAAARSDDSPTDLYRRAAARETLRGAPRRIRNSAASFERILVRTARRRAGRASNVMVAQMLLRDCVRSGCGNLSRELSDAPALVPKRRVRASRRIVGEELAARGGASCPVGLAHPRRCALARWLRGATFDADKGVPRRRDPLWRAAARQHAVGRGDQRTSAASGVRSHRLRLALTIGARPDPRAAAHQERCAARFRTERRILGKALKDSIGSGVLKSDRSRARRGARVASIRCLDPSRIPRVDDARRARRARQRLLLLAVAGARARLLPSAYGGVRSHRGQPVRRSQALSRGLEPRRRWPIRIRAITSACTSWSTSSRTRRVDQYDLLEAH